MTFVPLACQAPLKPLSASATGVVVIPQKGEYFVPAHLRTVWRRLQVPEPFLCLFPSLPPPSLSHLRTVWRRLQVPEPFFYSSPLAAPADPSTT